MWKMVRKHRQSSAVNRREEKRDRKRESEREKRQLSHLDCGLRCVAQRDSVPVGSVRIA